MFLTHSRPDGEGRCLKLCARIVLHPSQEVTGTNFRPLDGIVLYEKYMQLTVHGRANNLDIIPTCGGETLTWIQSKYKSQESMPGMEITESKALERAHQGRELGCDPSAKLLLIGDTAEHRHITIHLLFRLWRTTLTVLEK